MDAENPFRTPSADLTSTATTDGKLYSLGAVALGTFFGTPIAGAYFIVQNLKQLGRSAETTQAWAMGVGVFVALLALSFFLPDSMPATPITAIQVAGMYFYAKQLMEKDVTTRRAVGGLFFSTWRAVGIGLLFLMALLVAAVPLVMLLMEG